MNRREIYILVSVSRFPYVTHHSHLLMVYLFLQFKSTFWLRMKPNRPTQSYHSTPAYMHAIYTVAYILWPAFEMFISNSLRSAPCTHFHSGYSSFNLIGSRYGLLTYPVPVCLVFMYSTIHVANTRVFFWNEL